MRDPVTCCDGHSYERTAIAAWLSENSTSPKTNLPLLSKNIIPNHALRNSIETLKSLIVKEKVRVIYNATDDDVLEGFFDPTDDVNETVASYAKKQVLKNLNWLHKTCAKVGRHVSVSFGDGPNIYVQVLSKSSDSSSVEKPISLHLGVFLRDGDDRIMLEPQGTSIQLG